MVARNQPVPRFLVGMSRSGTTWVAKSLNEHPSLAVFGETQFWGKNYVPPGEDGLYDAEALERLRAVLKRNPLDSTITNGAEGRGWMAHIRKDDLPEIIDGVLDALTPPVAPSLVFERFCEAIARAEGKESWLEKTSRHVNWVDRIIPGMPDARFVVTLREPYSFMLSYKHQQDRGDRGSSERQQAFARRYHPLGAAIIWRTNLRSALRLARTYPDQVMLVYLHQIQEDPKAVLEQIQDFLRIESCPDLLGLPQGENSAFKGRKRPELPDDEAIWVNWVAKREIEEGGFAMRPVPVLNAGILRWAFALPRWAFRAYADIRGRTEGSAIAYLWRWLFPPKG